MSDVAILVLVTVGHASTPAGTSMLGAAQQMLGPGAKIVVETVEEIPADDDVVLLADMTDVDAVVEVTWPADNFNRAHVRVWPTTRRYWVERDLAFTASDTPAERGRTVGFTFAAMIPDRPVVVAAPTPTDSPPISPILSARPSPPVEVAAPLLGPPRTLALGAAATLAFAGPARFYGVSIFGSAWLGAGGLYARAGADARTASTVIADATELRISLAIGHEFRRGLSTTFGAHAAIFGLHQRITRDEEPSDRRSALAVGVSVMLDASANLVGGWDLLASGGGEAITSETRIFLNDNVVVRLPRIRVVTGIGLRLRF